MAPKRSAPMDDPKPVQSSDEENSAALVEEEEEEEVEEGSSSPEESGGPTEKPAPVTVKPELDSASESDTESDQPRSRSVVLPKRGSGTDSDLKESKRAKFSDGITVDKSEESKKSYNRIWSLDDEIAVLKGLIEFSAKKGIDPLNPSKDMGGFHEFIKKFLHFDVNLSQLKDKVSRLRKKYATKSKTFSKPHEQKINDLANRLWGNQASNGRAAETSHQKSRKPTPVAAGGGGNNSAPIKQKLKFDSRVSFSGLDDYVVKTGMEMVEGEEKEELERKWQKLNVEQLELFIKKNELLNEQAKLILAAYRREDDED